jgi:hypothetical protein
MQVNKTQFHDNGLQYNPVAACCHPQSWDDEFHQGYSTQWNVYQNQNTEQHC